jgi:uncharacterized protein
VAHETRKICDLKRENFLRRIAVRVLRVALLAYIGCFAILAMFQNHFVYFPSKAPERELLQLAADQNMEPWRDDSGAIIGWKLVRRGPPAQNRMVVFHGNAGFALDRECFAAGFEFLDSGKIWEVHLFEYPGYGARPGEPGEEKFELVAKAALDQLRRADSRPIFLLGESIGSGVACHLAGQSPDTVAGLILVTPFTSLADVAAHHYPLFPVRLLLRDRYDNRAALKNYRGPVAVLLAGRDEVIPTRFGRELFDGYAGPKRLWIQNDAMHNTLDYDVGAAWWREMTEFLRAK